MINFILLILISFQLYSSDLNVSHISISSAKKEEKYEVKDLLSRSKFTVFIAIDKDCPVLKKYIPTINELSAKFSNSDLTIYLISRASNITTSEMEQFVKSFQIRPEVFFDKDHKLLAALGITTISQAVLVDNHKMTILYSGRIDDKINYDSVKEFSKNNYLESAIKNSLAGKKIKDKNTRALGCSI